MNIKIKRLDSCENAVSTVVSAVLLLGIIVSVITVVHVQYIPQWKWMLSRLIWMMSFMIWLK
ncbi:MAG: hypothetical protein R2741_00870 [Methanolobus sp.]